MIKQISILLGILFVISFLITFGFNYLFGDFFKIDLFLVFFILLISDFGVIMNDVQKSLNKFENG